MESTAISITCQSQSDAQSSSAQRLQINTLLCTTYGSRGVAEYDM